MDMWFLDNEDRVFKERTAISELNDAVDWLEGLLWKIHEGQLHLEAIIVVDGHEYQILLSYPFLFPETPAWIKPKNPKKGHWSGHQYGNGGTLCLEWGPDNWHPEITGAQLIESAYKLLASEKPHAKNDGKDVLSRHSLTIGQELRSEKYRFFVSSNLAVYLYDQKKLSFGKIHSFFSFRGEQLKFYLQKLEPNDADIWIDDSIPLAVKDDVCEGNACEGLFFKVDCSSFEIEKLSTLGDLNKLLNNSGFENVLLDDGAENKFDGRVKTVLLIGKDLKPNFFIFFGSSEDKRLIKLSNVFSESNASDKRTPEKYSILNSKSVGIVGLGSVGSKISMSLARAGVASFYLVDDDVFLPENNCRNALNWRNVGDHKVDAVRSELKLIYPGIKIKTSKINLTEQESSSVINETLHKLGKCDMIINATGSHRVFNILASISKKYKKPLIWGEVYEGGIGGFLARSRPGVDPEPLLMRSIFLDAISSAPEFKSRAVGKYETEDDSGNVISASDPEVSIIAHMIADFSIDSLVNDSKQSEYPHSMYLVGLKKAWLFKAPFDTYPIETNIKITNKEQTKKSMSSDHKKFVLDALKYKKDEDNTTKKN